MEGKVYDQDDQEDEGREGGRDDEVDLLHQVLRGAEGRTGNQRYQAEDST